MRDGVEQCHSWGVVGVGLWELELDVENAAFIQCTFGTTDVTVPGEEVVVKGSGHNAYCRDGLVFYFL